MLETGTTLGPYEILAPIGAGGMGEVYKARDTRLDRIVAIKVLPTHLSDQTESRERFEREARAISALNHPHICTLHDIGRQGEIDFLVMEYLEGETLASRLLTGALPLDQAVKLAIDIADALDRAHRQGIVHRDLKPANVMLTTTGAARRSSAQVKLLDFGLAKLSPAQPAVVGVSMLPTAVPSADLTAKGMILGTLQYMAPEQLEGAEADARTDIFAFGALVYEMVTGQKAFQGKSQPSLIAAIMSAEAPSMSAVQAMSPPALDRVVRMCLAKAPDDRWQTMHDVAVQLRWIAEGQGEISGPSLAAAPGQRPSQNRTRLRWAAIAVAAVVFVALAVPAFQYLRGVTPPDEMRFTIETPLALNPPQLSVSPDGRWIALQARSESGPAIFVRGLNSTAITKLAGTDGAAAPFWSPDSRYIGFIQNGRLKTTAVIGGAPQDLTDATGVMAWGTRGILFRREPEVYLISGAGSEPRALKLETGPPVFAQFLPDGTHFIYGAVLPTPAVYVASIDSPVGQLLIPSFALAAYADPGYLLFQRQRTLYAQAFDANTQRLSGDPVQIADNVWVNPNGRGAFAVSQTGLLTYRGGSDAAAIQQFVWHDHTGKSLATVGKPDAYTENFDLSPDGTRIATSIFEENGGGANLWLMDWKRGSPEPFTFDTGTGGRDVVWFPSGDQVAYGRPGGGRGRGTGVDIVSKASNGLSEEHPVLETAGNDWVEDISQDGQYIAYSYAPAGQVGGASDIWVLPLFGDKKPYPFLESPFSKDEPHFSPDAKWMAYNSSESGTSQVRIVSFPDKKQRCIVSITGGAQPRWNLTTGRELYYLGLDGKMMAATIRVGDKLECDVPRELFNTGIPAGAVSIGRDQYDVTRDGQQFLVLKPVSSAAQSPLTVIVNWTRALK